MRVSTTLHSRRITREKPSTRDRSLGWDDEPDTALDLVAILALLKSVSLNAPKTRGKGKGRAVGNEGDLDVQKRTKKCSSSNGEVGNVRQTRSNRVQTKPETVSEVGANLYAVYHHNFEFSYTVHAAKAFDSTSEEDESDPRYVKDAQAKKEAQWSKFEAELDTLVNEQLSNRSSPQIDLGAVDITRRAATNLVAVHPQFGDQSRGLLNLPPVEQSFDLHEQDIHVDGCLMDSFYILQQSSCATISARLSAILIPKASRPPNSLPFQLRLEVEAAFIAPAIFWPVEDFAHRKSVDEARRHVIAVLFPQSQTTLPTWHGVTDIPFLYSILKPAPRLLSHAADLAIQPPALRPTLLPFQRRSVAWLLSREGKTITPSGHVVPQVLSPAEADAPPFWDTIPVADDEEWWYDRLHGSLQREKPEDNIVGALLAEEPGLGKTLECISLILLNPSVDRGPENKRWDAEAKVYVKEIQTTLIVTPQSLAQQWADELVLHAPSLKILMYDGWAKLPVPITEPENEDNLPAVNDKAIKAETSKKRKSANDGRGEPTKKVRKLDSQSTRKGSRRAAQMDVDESDHDTETTTDSKKPLDWCSYVNTFDVCITTYNVLQQDLNIARPPPNRPRRATASYNNAKRLRSPLIMCEWHRVIMDEVQMVGGGKAAEMVSLIPRISSLAVSGTPARVEAPDLVHVFKFLRVDASMHPPRIWARLLKAAYVNQFVALVQRYAIRTMKATVKDELTIPRQTRFLVPIELGRVERHVYDQNFETALLELGLDARGVAVTEGWEVDTTVLRSWLRKLRMICTHPQVGQLQNHADKLHKPGVLKTIGEVLEGMREQNWRNLMDDRKTKVQSLTTLAQLLQRNEIDPRRYWNALEALLTAEKEAKQLIEDVKAAMAEHQKTGETLKLEAAKSRDSQNHGSQGSSQDVEGKGKDKEREHDEEKSINDDEDDDLPRNHIGEEHRNKKNALQHRLRECRIALHKVLFLKGDVYHVLGPSHEDAENEAYAAAEDLRRMLLKTTEEAAGRAMISLHRDETLKALQLQDLLVEVPYCDKGGIRSAHLMEEANEIIQDTLNEQSQLLWEWRMKLVALLTQPLSSSNGDADGDEFARSLETQGEVEAYIQAYADLVADRREILTAERTLLAAHDVKEAHVRKTKAAQRAAEVELWQEDENDVELEKLDEAEIQPQHQVLQNELKEQRIALLNATGPNRAVKSVMVDLNNIAARIPKDDDVEKIIIKGTVQRLRALIADQGKLMDRLQLDLTLLRKAFNERISYFRQLQEISDTVVEATWEGLVTEAIDASRMEQQELETKINTGRARQRYMDHLTASPDGVLDDDDKTCVLCKCEFTRGYITPCAHVYCESCLKAWLSRKEGKVCPVCRVPIYKDQLQRFSIEQKPEQLPPPQLTDFGGPPQSRRQIQYNVIDPKLFEEIQLIESHGSYGSKIQTLVRHLLYLSITEPGAKSIVFSAWADSLHIIEHALSRNGISCLKIDQRKGKTNAAKQFRQDPLIQVLLLHGERENAGLNVTCASRVFLLESVVHHAFELQAIARIDRMGQTRPTEVYCYYAAETVEQNILDLAARRGQSLYTIDNSAGTLNVADFAMDSKKKEVDSPARRMQKGDFVFKTDDMLAIFFPHMFEDIEYLLPEGAVQDSEPSNFLEASSSNGSHYTPINAVAGPSRMG